MTRNRHFLLAILAATLVWPASAQLLSLASLNGAYNFRYLGLLTVPTDSARSMQGTITFDGKGGYTVTATGSAASGTLRTGTSGTYNLTSGGLFYMVNPVDATGNTFLFGGFANGAIVASSTDSDYIDTFVAIPAATTSSNATLSGLYRVAHLEFLNGSITQTRNTFFPMTADGAGSFGNATIKGTSQNLKGVATTQTSSGVTYSVTANGTGTLNFPAPSGSLTPANTLLVGNKTLYVSPDGNMFLAGTPGTYDFLIGIKAYSGNSPTTAFSGLYFTTLLENLQDTGFFGADGTSNLLGSAQIELAHQRTFDENFGTYDYSYGLEFSLNADGTVTYTDTGSYALGAGGNFLIGSGDGTNYQLTLYAKSQAISGTGVFLNPQGVVNAATNIPFSAQVAPGEFLSLYGAGMSGGTTIADKLPFPTSLGGVSVTINGTAAPLYYVSPTLISLVVPYSIPTDGSFLDIQVTSGGTVSNIVKAYSGTTSPGFFTLPPGGVGNGAILHADFTVVSPANPAKAGETVQMYLSGLGPVNSTVAAGAAGPTNPLANLKNLLGGVFIDGTQAQISYQGLAPQLAGLYQVNVKIPAGLSTGNLLIEIDTFDAVNVQATIPIGK